MRGTLARIAAAIRSPGAGAGTTGAAGDAGGTSERPFRTCQALLGNHSTPMVDMCNMLQMW